VAVRSKNEPASPQEEGPFTALGTCPWKRGSFYRWKEFAQYGGAREAALYGRHRGVTSAREPGREDPRRGLGLPAVFFAAILYGATAPFLLVNWSRYFLPPVLGATLLVAGGGGAFTAFVLSRAVPRRAPAADQSPAAAS